MLKKAFIISFIGLTIFIFLFFTNLFIITQKDKDTFSKYEQKGLDIKSNGAYQERKNVKKDLFMVDNHTRKHYIISSDSSQISLNRKNQKYELIENLNNIKLICFEKIDKTSKLQQIKYITALKGYYFFPSHNLLLSDVNLSFINAINSQKIDFKNTYFSGHANELNLTIQNKKPVIQASAFTGLFDPKKGFKCEN